MQACLNFIVIAIISLNPSTIRLLPTWIGFNSCTAVLWYLTLYFSQHNCYNTFTYVPYPLKYNQLHYLPATVQYLAYHCEQPSVILKNLYPAEEQKKNTLCTIHSIYNVEVFHLCNTLKKKDGKLLHKNDLNQYFVQVLSLLTNACTIWFVKYSSGTR